MRWKKKNNNNHVKSACNGLQGHMSHTFLPPYKNYLKFDHPNNLHFIKIYSKIYILKVCHILAYN